MKYNRISRRHFLQGAGGSFLALPFMPSLMPKAHADNVANPKFLVMFFNGHGGINLQNMNPIVTNPAIAGQLTQQALYSSMGHNMVMGKLMNLRSTRASNLPYLGSLPANDVTDSSNPAAAPTPQTFALDTSGNDFDNGASRLTPIIGSFVNDSLLAKMNLICGLDYMYDSGHNNAATGNFCNYNGNAPGLGNSNSNPTMKNSWVPTIDAVAANYPAFYGADNPSAPSVLLNTAYGSTEDIGGYLSCYQSSTGIVGNGNNPSTVGQLFSLLFDGLQYDAINTNKKDFILNKVHDDYVRVSRGAYGPGRRIGKDDRNRFEEFIANIVRIINGSIPYGACSVPAISSSDTSQINWANGQAFSQTQNTLSLYNQMVAAAFSCGLTRCFTIGLPTLVDQFFPSGSSTPSFTDGVTGPDSHQAVFHLHNWEGRQRMMLHSQRFFFQYAFYDLMQKLDATQAPTGGTLLDQSLMFWTQECGFSTHSGTSLPMICAGGAGGFIKTGNFVDYRHLNRRVTDPTYNGARGYQGIPYNRFLGTALQAMGVPPSAYELSPSLFTGSLGRIPVSSLGTVPGYGHSFQNMYKINGGTPQYIFDYQINDMSVPLPGIT